MRVSKGPPLAVIVLDPELAEFSGLYLKRHQQGMARWYQKTLKTEGVPDLSDMVVRTSPEMNAFVRDYVFSPVDAAITKEYHALVSYGIQQAQAVAAGSENLDEVRERVEVVLSRNRARLLELRRLIVAAWKADSAA